MKGSLFLLILIGQCSFLVCHLYEYHFIEETKTWKEAQTYCRAHYTDLAKVFDMTDMERLRDKNQSEAWIGLRNHSDAVGTWHWSLPGVEFNESETRWADREPNNIIPPENCVRMDNHEWKDVPCNKDGQEFICYDAKQSNKTFHLITAKMNWTQAQNYCREHHTDLVSGLQQIEDEEFINETIHTENNLWIGLFNDTWKWSDGSNFSFRNWDLESLEDEEVNKKCAMTMSDGKWSSDDCNDTKPFFCYDDKVILINESMTWMEALNYCRSNHRDLASIINPHQQRWVQERAKKAVSEHVWLGLRYTCSMDLWFWVNDNLVCYENWASEEEADRCDMAAAMGKDGLNKWFTKADSDRFDFICALK